MNFERELAIHRYVEALDNGEMDIVAEVLEMACNDPELDRILSKIDAAYFEEAKLSPIATDTQLIRSLIQKHLHSAFETLENDSVAVLESTPSEKTLTVRDVAKRLQTLNRVPAKDKDILDYLVNDTRQLPATLNSQGIRQLLAELKIPISERFLDNFRNTAIMLSMGRNQSMAQLAAAREQQNRPKKSN